MCTLKTPGGDTLNALNSASETFTSFSDSGSMAMDDTQDFIERNTRYKQDVAPNAQIQKDWAGFRDKHFKDASLLYNKMMGKHEYADSKANSNGVKDKTNEPASSSSSKTKLNYGKGNLSVGGKGRANFSSRKRTKAKGRRSQINKLIIK